MIKELYGEFFKKHWKYYLFYTATFIAIPLQQAGLPHMYGKLINSLKGKNINDAKVYLVYLLIIWIIIQVCMLLEKYGEFQIWPRLEAFIEEKIFANIIDRYNTSYQELKIGELLTKIIKLPWIIDYVQDRFKNFFVDNLLVIITNIIYLFYHSAYLGLGYMGGMLCYLVLGYKFNKDCKHNLYFAEIQYDHVHGIIEDSLNNLISIYTNNKHDVEKNKINRENTKTIKYQIKKEMCNTKYKIIFSILNVVIFVILNYTALYLYGKGKLNIGSLVAIFILNYNILHSLIMFYRNARTVVELNANLKYVDDFLSSIPDEEPTKHLKVNGDINIKFIDVFYSPNDSDEYLLNNFNLEIPHNQSVVFMGSVGSGKSTISKLIVRLLKPASGKILINKIPIEKYNINNLRDNIIYVPQSPVLFDRSLWDNITYGLPKNHNKKPSDIYNILESIGLNEVKKIFKEKMFKGVGKKGSELSGGQRQIVWLLRCVIQNFRVVIMDEPTSALDETSKENIKKLIEHIGINKTVIVITHDKTLTEYMDRLIVLDKGSIVSDRLLK